MTIAHIVYFKLDGHLGWKLGSPETNLEGDHPRTIPAKVWFKLAHWFLRKRLKCEKLTTDDDDDDDDIGRPTNEA
jgi:hypothetical protein